MTTWAKPLIEGALLLPTVSFWIFAFTLILMQHANATMPRGPGIWACRSPIYCRPEAIAPAPWKTRFEEGELVPDLSAGVPIWNQNRSGDFFVGVVLSLIVPWLASLMLNPFSSQLWRHFRWSLH